jgi:hypothetical protein
MSMAIVIDSSLFARPDLTWLDEIRKGCNSNFMDCHISKVPDRTVHQEEVVAIIGAGCAVAALVLNIIKMMKDEKEKWTYKKLLEECDSYLALHGIKDYTFEYATGFDNLINDNGKPCIVKVHSQEGNKTIYLNIGKTTEVLIVTPKSYDYRSLPP